jgi:hypothetical protein
MRPVLATACLKEREMTLDFRTLRLVFSGAIVGVAIAGLLGFDTSSFGAAGLASLIGAGGTVATLKFVAII